MNTAQGEELVRIAPEGIRFHCPMDGYTTFRTGGEAAAVCFPTDLDLLRRIILFLRGEKIPYLVVGRGSNLLFRDGGFSGVVLILKGMLASIEQDEKDHPVISPGGGVPIGELMAYCRLNGLSGLEFLAGIPGTVGGAVAMNAGAFGKEIGSVVEKVRFVSLQGKPETVNRSQLTFSYRSVSLSKGVVIYGAKFRLEREEPEVISRRVKEFLRRRRMTQPLELPSGGSVFKNPSDDYAGRLIEEAGLKGRRIGGAMISSRHANFIVNRGGAKTADVLALMDLVRNTVKERTGIELEPEIEVVGI